MAGVVLLRLAPRRGPWGAEDLHPISFRDRGKLGRVRVNLERRRNDALGSGLADLSQEALELHGPESDQELGFAGLHVERVRDSLGPECKRAGLEREARISNPDGQLTLEDVEPLVLLGMHVPR